MNDFLQQQFLDNTILLWLEVLGTIFFAFIVKHIISKYFARILFKLYDKAGKNFHKDAFTEFIVRPLENFLFILIIVIALDKLAFPALLDFSIYKISSRLLIESVGIITLIITFINLCIKLLYYIAFVLERRANQSPDQTQSQLIVFFKDFFRVIFVVLGILLTLKFVLKYEIGNLVTGLSIVGAAIALATKESLENLIASFIIFFDKPFTTGDTVRVQDFTGTVEKIGLRSTRIRTEQKTYITVPNKQMVDTILDNITLRTQRRADVKLELSLATSPEDLQKIIPAIKAILEREPIEAHTVFLSDTGKAAHIISIEYYASMQQTLAEFNALREEVNFEIIGLLNKNNIGLAGAVTNIELRQNQKADGIQLQEKSA